MCGSSTSSQTTSIPPWLEQAGQQVTEMAGAQAQKPYQAYTGEGVAGMTPMQQQAMGGVGSYSTLPNIQNYMNQTDAAGRISAQGAQTPYLGAASGALGAAAEMPGNVANASPYMSAANNYLGAAGSAGTSASAAQPYMTAASNWLTGSTDRVTDAMGTLGRTGAVSGQGAVSPYVQGASQSAVSGVGDYMSPYTQGVINKIESQANRNLQENVLPGVNDAFVKSGQFGSTRNADFTLRALRDNQQAVSEAQAGALESGWNSALANRQQDLSRQLGAGGLSLQGASTDINKGLGIAGQQNALAGTLGNIAGQQGALGQQAAGYSNNDFSRLLGLSGAQSGLGQQAASYGNTDFGNQLQWGAQQAGLGQQAAGAAGVDANTGLSAANQGTNQAIAAQNQYNSGIDRLYGYGSAGQQQQQAQNNWNYSQFQQEQAYPWQQIQNYSSVLRGTPSSQTTTGSQGANPLQTAIGAGTAVAALRPWSWFRNGGGVPQMAAGGFFDDVGGALDLFSDRIESPAMQGALALLTGKNGMDVAKTVGGAFDRDRMKQMRATLKRIEAEKRPSESMPGPYGYAAGGSVDPYDFILPSPIAGRQRPGALRIGVPPYSDAVAPLSGRTKDDLITAIRGALSGSALLDEVPPAREASPLLDSYGEGYAPPSPRSRPSVRRAGGRRDAPIPKERPALAMDAPSSSALMMSEMPLGDYPSVRESSPEGALAAAEVTQASDSAKGAQSSGLMDYFKRAGNWLDKTTGYSDEDEGGALRSAYEKATGTKLPGRSPINTTLLETAGALLTPGNNFGTALSTLARGTEAQRKMAMAERMMQAQLLGALQKENDPSKYLKFENGQWWDIKTGKPAAVSDRLRPLAPAPYGTGSPEEQKNISELNQLELVKTLQEHMGKLDIDSKLRPGMEAAIEAAKNPALMARQAAGAKATAEANAPYQGYPYQPGGGVMLPFASMGGGGGGPSGGAGGTPPPGAQPGGAPQPGMPAAPGGVQLPAPGAQPAYTREALPGGGVIMREASGLGQASQTALEEKALNTAEHLARLDGIRQSFKPEYLQILPKIGMNWAAIKEKGGIDLGPKERSGLEDFTKFRRDAVSNMNQGIKDQTGAAMAESEAKRIIAGMPNPGQGIFDGDSPTEFKAKMDSTAQAMQNALLRYNYARSRGVNPLKTGIELDDVPRIFNERGREIRKELKEANPGMPNAEREAAVKQRLAKEFGLVR